MNTDGKWVDNPDRTKLALDRTILANERTYAAWIRTGLAALVSGLGVERFLLNTIPLWSIHAIAAILLLFSAASFLLASWRYRHLKIKLADLDVQMVPMSLVRIMSVTLTICALIALLAILKIPN